jgi:tetratricopeptide (TPR) repeat protein
MHKLLRAHGGGFVATSTAAVAAFLFSCAGPVPPPVQEPEPPLETAAPIPVLSDAQIAASNRDFATAVRILEEILSGNSNDIEALRLLAEVQAAAGDRLASAAAWERVAALDPYDPEAAYEVGTTLASEGRWEEVRVRMLQIEEAGAADGRHHLLAGRAAVELGYRSEARRQLLLAGDIELAHILLGTLAYGSGDLDEAAKAFEDALRINPVNFTANLHLGYISYHRGMNRDAIGYYRTAYEIDDTSPLACLSLAAAFEKAGERASAVEYYKAGLLLAGTPAAERRRVYLSLVRLLYELGRDSEIEIAAKRGLSEFPDEGGLYFYWGEALLRLNHPADAKEKLKEAARDPQWRDPALKRFHSIR